MAYKNLETNKPPLGLIGKYLFGLEETSSVTPEALEKFRTGRLKKVIESKPNPEDPKYQHNITAPSAQAATADAKKKTAPSAQAETADAKKKLKYLEEKLKEPIGLSQYRKGLILTIKILQHCPTRRDGENPPLLDAMGIDRSQIIEMLKRIFSPFDDRFKQNIVVTSIGNFNNRKNLHTFLFNDVFKLNEHSSIEIIDDLLNELGQTASKFNEAEKDSFFQLADMDKYLMIFQAIEAGEVKKEHVIDYARSKLGLGRKNIPMMDFLSGVNLNGEPSTDDTSQPATKNRPDPTTPYNINSLIENVEITPKIIELIELAEEMKNLEEDSPQKQKLMKLNHIFFKYFLSLKSEVPLQELKTHVVKILVITENPTKETINEDLETLYDEVSALLPNPEK